jgi:hypothetical protein
MVLGVQAEDTAAADHQVVDIGAFVTDRNGVQDTPLLTEFRQAPADRYLSLAAFAISAVSRSHAEDTPDSAAERCGLAQLFGPLGNILTGTTEGKIV